MSLKIVFCGFRHGHIFTLYNRCKNDFRVEIAGACEPEPEARQKAEKQGVAFTHDRYDDLIAGTDCDVVVAGETYGRRAKVVLSALDAKKHVISDKPFCVSLSEWEMIRNGVRKSGCQLGCMFDLRTCDNMQKAAQVIQDGVIGEVTGIQFNGMHFLNYGVRPDWYFAPGMHGGTINDIGIHVYDYLPVLTGMSIRKTLFAVNRNVCFPEEPAFKNAAQLVLEMENGSIASGDVSYLAPGCSMPANWRFLVTGKKGALEFNVSTRGIRLYPNGGKPEILNPELDPVPDYWEAFLLSLEGKKASPDTEENLRTAKNAVVAQENAV